MKIIFALAFICTAAFAETSMSPIVNDNSKKPPYDGPKQPIVTKPAPPPPPPSAPRPEPREPKRDLDPSYWNVVSWFDNGQDVKWSEIKGMYVGYCVPSPGFHFPWNERTTRLLAYLPDSKGQPQMLRSFTLQFVIGAGILDPANNDYLPPEYVQRTHHFLREDKRYRSAGFTDTPTVTQKLNYEGTTPYSQFTPYTIEEFRRFGNMIVSRIRSLNRLYYVSHEIFELTSPGMTVDACYYTKKVAD